MPRHTRLLVMMRLNLTGSPLTSNIRVFGIIVSALVSLRVPVRVCASTHKCQCMCVCVRARACVCVCVRARTYAHVQARERVSCQHCSYSSTFLTCSLGVTPCIGHALAKTWKLSNSFWTKVLTLNLSVTM